MPPPPIARRRFRSLGTLGCIFGTMALPSVPAGAQQATTSRAGTETMARERVHVLTRALNMHRLFAQESLRLDACSVRRATGPQADAMVHGEPELQRQLEAPCADTTRAPVCIRVICVDSINVSKAAVTRVYFTVNRGGVQYREEHEFARVRDRFDWVRVVLQQAMVND